MRMYLLCAALVAISGLHAQITINTEDLPSAGDTVRYSQVFGPSFDDLELQNTGADVNWDYTWLEVFTQDVDTFLQVEDAPFLYQFFFNNAFLYPDSYSNLATKTTDFSFGDFSLENPYTFYNNDEESYHATGFGVTVTGLPISVPNDGNEILYAYPMDYGNTFSSDFETTLEVPGLITWVQTGTRSVEVDGWGTLTTPFGTFDVLRQVALREASDSTYINLIELGTSIPRLPERVYSWVAEGMHAPVLEITTQEIFGTEAVTAIRYQDVILEEETPDNVEEFAQLDVVVFPNPSNGTVRLQSQATDMLDVTLYNALGQRVYTAQVWAGEQVHLEHLAAGSYTLHISGDQGQSRQSLQLR
ncbi:MAG: T9SS type A sorting domain-containing protein [Flavobacteriales bacterium]